MDFKRITKITLTNPAQLSWTFCPKCQGRGRIRQKIRKKVKLSYQAALLQFEQQGGVMPDRPKAHLSFCPGCHGAGLSAADYPPAADTKKYPNVAIIGGGIGGVALAVACLHRGIPFTLYERDSDFSARSQGYGLTLQQASKAIEGFGVFSLEQGLVSTRHVVHRTDGKILGEWGMRKWLASEDNQAPKRTNVHIARQSLRLALLQQLAAHPQLHEAIKWGHQLVDLKALVSLQGMPAGVALSFSVDGEIKTTNADLVVGADGIRSAVRNLALGDDASSLRYLDCIAILGICPLSALTDIDSELLDSATVFQTANGHERIYVMPFDADSVMWQLSFPMLENDAKALSAQGAEALKAEARQRTQWHAPIPQILAATPAELVSGYPIYDRALLTADALVKMDSMTLLGDAAHPMSPFKGQGANQALLDALSLARTLVKGCHLQSNWREVGIRECVLNEFEAEMLERSAVKVKGSANAAEFLHSEVVLHESNEPRGRCLKSDSRL
ncbi:MAG TPA: FAD-dependent monooxygenase [Marinospirillum sp.]|uniref:FAD-dependent monooxygenase n=1 Tax=Marinospirillum sp. TaxID=2183934 RepID=UPI002B4A89C3|nr:FAD-dependent monooxygenase [Marinospirillum sp.]HKM15312.1 FAD-dependent monooxygenase [Marinospirillum sp.]